MKMIKRSKLNWAACAACMVASAAFTTIAAPPVVVVTPPTVAVSAPPAAVVAPGVAVNIGVPDSYTWDGDEYVGVIGGQYYYLGPNHVWLPMPSGTPRYVRFHQWEVAHHDWQSHATRNEKYRLDAQGHEHAWQGGDHDRR